MEVKKPEGQEEKSGSPWWAGALVGLVLGLLSSCSVTVTSKLSSIDNEVRRSHRLLVMVCKATVDPAEAYRCY